MFGPLNSYEEIGSVVNCEYSRGALFLGTPLPYTSPPPHSKLVRSIISFKIGLGKRKLAYSGLADVD